MNFDQPEMQTEKQRLEKRLLEIKQEMSSLSSIDKEALEQEEVDLEFEIQHMRDSIASLEGSTTELQEKQIDIPENMPEEEKQRFVEAQKIRERKDVLVNRKKEIKETLAKLSSSDYFDQLSDERYKITQALEAQ